jgi:hypothetical protein
MGQGGISSHISLYTEKPIESVTIDTIKAIIEKNIEESDIYNPSVLSALRQLILSHPMHAHAFILHVKTNIVY